MSGAVPPLGPLVEVAGELEREGIACALGGSGLLAALGLWDTVHDWDLTTDAPLDRVSRTLARFSPVPHGASGVHADAKLVIGGGAVEVIVGFAMHGPGGVVRLPTIAGARWNGVALGSPEAWAVAYALLGRAPKARLLFEALERNGADPVALARLLSEPLPDDLRARLAALPRRRS